jgi:hypothetical protein
LRETVGELRPVVLEQCDLREALWQLTQTVASDGGQTIAVDTTGWPSGARTSADPLLFGIARELLSRVLTRAGGAGLQCRSTSLASRPDCSCALTVLVSGKTK